MVRALAEQVQIEVGEHAAVAIRIVDLDDVTAGEGDAQPVVGNVASPGSVSLEQPVRSPPRASARSSPVATSRTSTARAAGWSARIDDAAGRSVAMRAEHGERIAMRPAASAASASDSELRVGS